MMSSTPRIPLLDTAPEIESIWDELSQAMERVVRSGHFIMGPSVKAFEEEAARYLGAKHAVACNSGTDALVMGVRALGLGEGDEVITSAFTFFATAEAISHAGAVPVFADIDPRSYNLDPAEVEAKITPRTKAILPVHLYGQACDMDAILSLAERRGLKVLEDVAQAFGGEHRSRKLSTLGDAGALSFFPSKNLGAFGDGGMLVTNDDSVAEAARMLRVHGAKKKYYNEVLGLNSRLDEMQAAVLSVKLPHLDDWNEGRRRAASRYNEMLRDAPGVETPSEADFARHVYHQYTIRITGRDRDETQSRLKERGIDTMIYYPAPLHRLPVYAGMNVSLPETERAAREVLSLPLWPKITPETQERVVDGLLRALASD